jgi:hypothetical protein
LSLFLCWTTYIKWLYRRQIATQALRRRSLSYLSKRLAKRFRPQLAELLETTRINLL